MGLKKILSGKNTAKRNQAEGAGQRKKQRGESSRREPSVETNPYASSLTEEHTPYLDKLNTKEFIVERIFQPGEDAGHIMWDLANRGWSGVATEHTEARPSVVIEFYAALAAFPGASRVRVRGVDVPFAASIINKIYGLKEYPNESEDELRNYQTTPDYEEIITTLTYPGTQWVGNHKEFPTNSLNRVGRAWLSFITQNLQTNKPARSVQRQQAILLHAICANVSIDIGRVLEEDIVALTRLTKKSCIGHPCLITRLCIEANVPIDPAEPTLEFPAPMDAYCFNQLATHPNCVDDPSGLGFHFDDEEPPEVPPSSPPQQHQPCPREASSSQPPQNDSFNMSGMRNMMAAHFAMHRAEQAWIAEMGERQVLESTHRAEWERTMVANHGGHGSSSASLPEVYPSYPGRLLEPFPTFPPFPEEQMFHQQQQQYQQGEQDEPFAAYYGGGGGGPSRGE